MLIHHLLLVQELQRALATLVFPPSSPKCPAMYLRLYEPSRWEDLVVLFRKVNLVQL